MIESSITKKESEILTKLAKKSKGPIIEIGSWIGTSTIALAKGTKHKVYAIDPHTGMHEQTKYGIKSSLNYLLENIKKNKIKNVEILVCKSMYATKKIKNEIGMVFIDGDHRYEEVKKDINSWGKRLKINGIIAIHDTVGLKKGVKKAVTELIYNSKNYKVLGICDSITFAQKTKKLTPKEKLNNQMLNIYRGLKSIRLRGTQEEK